MRKKLDQQTLEVFENLAKHLGADSFTVTTPIICDHCRDEEKEAFPYYVNDATGKEWPHLCNECFDELECSYPDLEEEIEQPKPYTPGSSGMFKDWSGVNIERKERKR